MATEFRSEIAGLRAIAVMGVVLFHLKVPGFDGGFLGVDVFFVISGYLISRNILRDLKLGRFSLAQFYVRRTRRIYPALIFTVVVTYLCGALWCAPDMFRDLAKESTHALLSIANIQYWRESHQYFAANSDELALLHCWSLSAEEQFYLFWPVMLVVACKWKRPFQVIGAAGIMSFVLSVILTRTDPAAVFFLMPFRIFEFAIGAFVLQLESRFRIGTVAAEWLSTSGLVGILASVLLFRSDMAGLEVAYLLPCAGAAATIWAGNKTRAARIITIPVMIGVGAISYSLYLCHWPVIFFARFIFGDVVNGPVGIAMMSIVMVVIATAMNRYIERRFIVPSEGPVPSSAKNSLVFVPLVLALVAVTHATFLFGGLTWRLPESRTELSRLPDFPIFQDLEPSAGATARMALMGDSLAAQYLAGLTPLLSQLNMGVQALGGSSCPVLEGVALKGFRRKECILARDEALKRLSETNVSIIFTQKWAYYDDATIDYAFVSEDVLPPRKGSYAKLVLALERTLGDLVAHGHRIMIIGNQVNAGCVPNHKRRLQGPLPHAAAPPCPARSKEEVEKSNVAIDRMLSRIQAKWPDKIELLRPEDYFCDQQCPVERDGVWLYFDASHFSVAGSNYMVSRAESVLRDFLTKK
jgi:peptidoglycan/LPS O-acetylase OafA/YrhL